MDRHAGCDGKCAFTLCCATARKRENAAVDHTATGSGAIGRTSDASCLPGGASEALASRTDCRRRDIAYGRGRFACLAGDTMHRTGDVTGTDQLCISIARARGVGGTGTITRSLACRRADQLAGCRIEVRVEATIDRDIAVFAVDILLAACRSIAA